MKLFIAVPLSEGMNKALMASMHDLKKSGVQGNYVPLQNLHVTLAYIGEYQDADAVKAVMTKIPHEKFRLGFSEFGNFGDTFWIGIKGNQKLKKYVTTLRAALKAEGIPVDPQEFKPHVTMVRKMKGKRPVLSIPKEDMNAEAVFLLQSTVKDDKITYRKLFSV